MPSTPHGTPTRALWQALISFEPQKIVPQIAVRNTVGFVCAVVLGTVYSSPSTGVVAGLGALNVCYSDGLDPYALRARRMLMATLLVGAAVVWGAISAHSNVAAVAVAATWAFAAGMLVSIGTTAADLGVITLVTLVVFAAKPLPAVEALEAGAVAIGGGLIQTLLSTFLWPIRRFEPERRIIAGIYDALARVARTPLPASTAPPMAGQISDAQDSLAPLAGDHSVEAERYVFLLAQAERIRLSLLNTDRLRRRIARDESGAAAALILDRILDRASAAIQLIGHNVLREETAGAFDSAIGELNAELIVFETFTPPAESAFFAALLKDARYQGGTLRSQIRSAGWVSAAALSSSNSGNNDLHSGSGATADAGMTREPWRLHFEGHRARLLANLSFDSIVFRHAVRMAACLAVGDILGRALALQRTYWIPMTIAIVLKPDFTGTFARGVLRIGGTMAGLVLATVLFRYIHGGIAIDIAFMALFTLLLRWAGPANYGVFVAAISALIVLLAAVTGVPPAAVIGARALNTSLGGSLALLAYAIWPSQARGQAAAALADMLDAYRTYARAVFDAYRNGSLTALDQFRMATRRTRSNAQASVDSACGEPGISARQAASLTAILVYSHGFVHAVMAMESRLYRERRDPAPAWMPAFAVSVDTALVTLSGALRRIPGVGGRLSRLDVEMPSSGTSGNELLETEADRIRTSLRSLGEELAKPDWL